MTRNIEIKLKGEIRELKTAFTQAKKEITQLKSKVKSLENSSKSLKTMLATTFGVTFGNLLSTATLQLKEFAKQGVTMAFDMEQAWQAFSTRVGSSADDMVKGLDVASRSMVSDLNLINAANRALMLGLDANQLPELMEIARVRAKFMGIEVTSAFADITLGIGRQSRLILDNLGIILNIKKTYEEYALSIGKTRIQLTEFEKRQAVANAVMTESEGIVAALSQAVLTNKERWQQLKAMMDNWIQESASEVLSITEDIDFAMSDLGKTVTSSAAEVKDAKDAWRLWREEQVESEKAISSVADAIRLQGQALQETVNSLKAIGDITLVGEREKNIDILQKEKELAKEQLNLLRMQEVPLNKKRELQDLIVEGQIKGTDVSQLQNLMNEIQLYDDQQTKVNDLGDEIKELRLEKKFEFDLVKKIEAERGKLAADEIDSVAILKEEFIKMVDVKVENYNRELTKLAELKESMSEHITQLEKIRSLSSGEILSDFGEDTFEDIKIGPFKIGSRRVSSVNDAIIKSDGQIIKFNPKDNILLAKDFPSLGGASKEPLLATIIVQLDGSEVSRSVGRFEAERLSRRGI